MKRKFSLQGKLMISILLVIVFFGFLATVFVFQYSRNSLIENEKDGLVLRVQGNAFVLEREFGRSEHLVSVVARADFIKKYLAEENPTVQDLVVLSKFNDYNVENIYSAIYLLDDKGTTLVSTDKSFVGQNYSFREYFKGAILGEPQVDIAVGVTSGELGYYFSHPVVDDQDKIIGVTVFKMRPDFIDEVISLMQGRGGQEGKKIYLFDELGVVLHSGTGENVLGSIGQLSESDKKEIENKKRYSSENIFSIGYDDVFEEIVSTKAIKKIDFFDSIKGQNRILVVGKLERLPFCLMFDEDADVFSRTAFIFSFYLGVFVFSAALLAFVLIYFLVGGFLRPLRKLNQAVKAAALGNLSKRFKITTTDEIGVLGGNFNKLISSLQRSLANVENQVKEQTQNIEDQRAAILNILEDVQEEKEKSESLAQDLIKFKLAVESTSEHVVITDSEGIVLFVNPAAEKITGFNSKEILGKKVGTKDLWGGLMKKSFYEKVWKTIKEEKKIFSGEITNKRKNGEKYIAYANISPVLNEKGDVVFFVATERDVTKEREVERMKTEFVSVASHQLRTPLTAIKLLTEVLSGERLGKLNKKQKEYMSDVELSTKRMINLVNDLLNVSRLETGRLKIEPVPTQLEDFITSIIHESEGLAKEKECDIIFEKPEVKMEQVPVDPTLMQQVVHNLITNAIRYSKKGACKIVLSLKLRKEEGDILVSVKDSGIGIAKEDQVRIFERFFRSDKARKAEAEGSGLGLYVAKMIVEASGGKIWFESEGEGKGAIFYFTIPAKGMREKEGERSLATNSN